MATPLFQVPLALLELEEPSEDPGLFRVQDAPKLDLGDRAGVLRTLEGVGSKLLRRGGIDSLSENESFDVLYAFVRTFPSLPGNIQSRLLDILSRAVRAASAPFRFGQAPIVASDDDENAAVDEAESARVRSNALKMATFLLFTAIASAEASHAAGKGAEGPKKKRTAGAATAAAAKKGKKKAAKRRGDDSDDDSDDSDDDSDDEGFGRSKSKRGSGGGAAKGAANAVFDWSSQREASVGALSDVLSFVDMGRLWTMGVPDQRFIDLFCRTAFQMLEQPLPQSSAIRTSVLKLLAVPLQLLPASNGNDTLETQVVATLMHLLSCHEHMVSPLADLCAMATDSFAVSVLREVVRVDLGGGSASSSSSSLSAGGGAGGGSKAAAPGLKHLGLFLVELSALMPQLVMRNMSFLLPLLDAEPYSLRSSIVNAIANVLAGATAAEQTSTAVASGAGAASGGGADSQDKDDEEEEEVDSDAATSSCMNAGFASTRDSLLNVLTERAHDVNSFTRAAVVRSWCLLAEKHALPLARVHAVGLLALDRLGDKSQIVRKAAVQLLVSLLEHNPFMGTLDPTLYEAKALELEVWLSENPLPEDAKAMAKQQAKEKKEKVKAAAAAAKKKAAAAIPEGNEESEEDDGEEGEAAQAAAAEMEEEVDDDDAEEEDDDEEEEEDVVVSELRLKRSIKLRELDFFLSATAFIALLQGASSQLEALLRSKSVGDSVEALRFFTCACHFQLPCAAQGLRSSWNLVWSSDAAVVEEVLKAFLLVHACEAGSGSGESGNPLIPGRIATNLTNVVGQASAAERTCLEELLRQLVEKKRLGSSVFAALRKGCTEPSLPVAKRALAMQVLAMCCAATDKNPEDGIIAGVMGGDRQLLVLAEATLGLLPAEGKEDNEENDEKAAVVDWELVRCACLAFKRVATKRNQAAKANINKGDGGTAAWEAVVLKQCVAVLRGDCCSDDDDADTDNSGGDDTLAPSAGGRWFAAAEEAMGCAFALSPKPEAVCFTAVTALHAKTLGRSGSCHPAALARLCHVLGGAALGLLVYTESKAAQLKKVLQTTATKAEKKLSKSAGGKGGDDNSEEDEEFDREAELGMAAEAELEHDQRVTAVVEGEVAAKGLLAAFEPLLLAIVGNECGQFESEVLRQAATLALTKYMCVSPAACELHLPLLFTCLQREKWASVRGNVVVALGDLAFRFPNAVEPWTSQIYRRLRDEDSNVRGQTLMVLTHLILNDMVKVKGQVSEMVLSLEDVHAPTADLARLFFQELSKRGNNPVYNLLPDIVSRLSQDAEVTRDVFRRVMPFLMGFITKDKHSEALTEKLCFRFATCNSMAQTQDLAFCLAQLPMNDKSLKKLDALLKTYHSALFDDEVFKSFSALVSKAKKFAKPEMRDAVNEYAAKIASIHSGGSGEVAAVVGEDDAAAAAAGGEEGEGEAGKSDGDKEDVGAPFTEKAGDENQPDAGDDDAENGKKGGRRKSVADKEKPLPADKENTRRKARSTAR